MALVFLFCISTQAQNKIFGIVTDEETKTPIEGVSVLLKNREGIVLDYSTTNIKGEYSIQTQEDGLLLETSILTYQTSRIELDKINKTDENIEINIPLMQRVDALDEVVVQAEKRQITVKNDTTVYSTNKFKDGTERVLEDILKKLPGITVEENGLIKFKGKSVSRLLLDNDNIFDANYAIGTKNLSADIIEGVEAIEDYHDNALLKGVKTSEDVAINLKLKKGMADLSGDANLGLGIDDKQLAKINALLVSKKVKAFAPVSFNNIGDNYSPYNFVSNTIDISKLSELSQRTSNLVTNNGFNSILPENRISVNNNFFGSVNSLFKINDKTSIRVNYNHFNDKLIRQETNNTVFGFNNETININTGENFVKRPLVHASAYEFIYKINKSELLTSVGKIDFQKINNTSNGFNNEDLFSNASVSRDLFFSNKLEYTKRIKKATVFQSAINVSSNDLPQNVDVTTNIENVLQRIDFKKSTFDINSSLLSKVKKSEYAVKLGFNFDESFIDSDLRGFPIINENTINNIYYRISKPYLNLDLNYTVGKWNFTTSLQNEIFNIRLTDTNLDAGYSNTLFAVYPKITTSYFLNKVSSLYANYNFSNQIPEAQNVFSGLILTNNRSVFNNDFSFNLFNAQSAGFGFRVNDFYNLFQFNIYTNYNYRKFGFLPVLNVNEDLSFSTNIVDAVNISNLQFGFRLEKYLHFLRSTVNLNSNYNISQYQNIINDSGLRNNTSRNLLSEFKIRTGFKGALNFENNLFINNNNFESDLGGTNEFTSFQNDFSIKYMKNNFQFIINSQYFKPDLNSNISGDLFLDATIRLTSKNKKMEYMIRANNLLNQKTFRNINQTDLSSSIFEHNLQERFALFSVGFRF